MNVHLELYLEADKKLVITHKKDGKVPIAECYGWNKKSYVTPSLQKLQSIDTTRRQVNFRDDNGQIRTEIHYQSVSWALAEDDFIIDVDKKHGGLEGIKVLEKEIQKKDPSFSFDYTVKTQNNGYHIYYKLAPNQIVTKLKKSFGQFQGVEFLKNGSCCNVVNETEEFGDKEGFYRWYDRPNSTSSLVKKEELPQKLLPPVVYEVLTEAYDQQNEQKIKSVEGKIKASEGKPQKQWTKDKVLSYLRKLNPSMLHPNWIKVGLAIHDFDPSNEGLVMWDEWSSRGSTYKKGECAQKWACFHSDQGVTVKSLAYAPTSEEERKEWFSTEYLLGLENKVEKKKEMEFIKNSSDGELSDKYKNWVYVESRKSIFHIKSKKEYGLNSWAQRYYGFENGGKLIALLGPKNLIRVVYSLTYLPYNKNDIVEDPDEKGNFLLNIFNPSLLAKPDAEYTEEGIEYTNTFKKHIELLCNSQLDGGEEGEKNGERLMQWLAWQIQRIGIQKRFCPLIHTNQGFGKGYIESVLRRLLGRRNVGITENGVLTGTFTSWRANKCVTVFQEFYAKGKDQHTMESAYKTAITDEMVLVHCKGKDPYYTENVTNYIAFTNKPQALEIEDKERRFWIINPSIKDIGKLVDKHNAVRIPWENGNFRKFKDSGELFKYLYEKLDANLGQLAKMLGEYEITEEFANLNIAPMTKAKEVMIENQKENIEYLDDIRCHIEEGGEYFNTEVVSSKHLFSDFLTRVNPHASLNNWRKNNILTALGYEKLKTRMCIVQGTNVGYTIWAKKEMNTQEVLESFNSYNEEVPF